MDEEVMSDDSDAPKQHSKLLSAITKMDFNERIKPASRKEPSVQVSEFHLAKSKGKAKAGVDVGLLAEALSTPQTLTLRRKMTAMKHTSTTLAKPLEKIVEDKVKRQAGYEKVKTVLSRWDSVVEHNRVADQLEFPAKGSGIQVHETNIFSSVMKPQTELEKKLATMLEDNGYASKKLKEPEEDPFPMTLEEVLAQRKEFGNLKRKSIQQQMKAWRQNKIKSKKFHRILRREKMRQQIKEFEALKEKNPEEALKRLDAIEKSRAHERASLRHKNTGTWAKNLQIRAKYNKDCRQVLAQQIELSRELSQKVGKPAEDSSDDDEAEDGVAEPHPDLAFSDEEEAGQKKLDDINGFVSGYRKFWEQQNKQKATEKKAQGKDSEEEEIEDAVEVTNGSTEVEEDEQLELMEELEELRREQKKSAKKQKIAAKPENMVEKKTKKAKKRKSTSGSWMVEDASKVIDLFDHLEEKQDRLIKKSIDKMKAQVAGNEGPSKTKKGKEQKEQKSNSKKAVSGNSKLASKKVETNQPERSMSPSSKDPPTTEEPNVDPTKFLQPKPLKSSQGQMVVVGGEDLDDDRGMEQQKEMLAQLFADDDLVEEFRKEKDELNEKSKPTEVDMTLPGWGEWGGSDMKTSRRKRKRFILKPKVEAPRKDRNLENVILNESCDTGLSQHQVNDLPFPFRSVKEFEASIRAPIGRTWVPESAHRQMSAPRVVIHAGQKIEPMTEDALVQTEKLLIKKSKNIRTAK